MKMKKKTTYIITFLVMLVLSISILLALVFNVIDIRKPKELPQSQIVDENDDSNEKVNNVNKKKYQNLYNENKEINSDYIGHIIFDSGIIDLPVVQGLSNDDYLRTDWKTMKSDKEGSIFLDERSTFNDQNLIIYGHYVYPSYDPSRTHMFTPLELLLEEENYADNSTLILALNGEIRHYQIVAVYYCELDPETDYTTTSEDMEYYLSDFSDEYFDIYKNAVKAAQRYETGIDFTNDDKFLTLQTCVYKHDELREIVLCKEIEIEYY